MSTPLVASVPRTARALVHPNSSSSVNLILRTLEDTAKLVRLLRYGVGFVIVGVGLKGGWGTGHVRVE